MTCQYHIKMLIIHIRDSMTALAEQHPFACCVFFKACMLIGPDMIRRQIGKDADLKWNTGSTMHHQSLGRYFHDADLAACLHHLCKIFLHKIGFRRSVAGRNMSITDNGLNGSDQSHLVSSMLQNSFYHKCSSGLSLGSCDSDHFQLLRRMIKIRCGQHGKRITAVLHQY